jgi:hypothetical protein
MHKTTTLKDFNVFLLKACLTTLILGFSFSVSFAQKQSANVAKPTSDEKRKQMQAANDASASAAFSDAVKNESSLKAPAATVPTSVSTPATTTNAAPSMETRQARMKAAAATKNTDLKPVTTERTAAEIARKKAGQNNQAVKAVRPLSKTIGN